MFFTGAVTLRVPSPGRTARRRAPARCAAVLTLLVAGCATSSRTIALHYPPATEHPPHLVDGSRDGGDVVPAVVGAFEDARPGSRVGETLTRWHFHTTTLEAAEPIVEWVRAGMEIELARAGFDVHDAPYEGGSPGIRLEGRIEEAFVSRRFYLEARVKMTGFVRCTCHGKILLLRSLLADVSLDSDTQNGEAEALSRALQQVARDFALAAGERTSCTADFGS